MGQNASFSTEPAGFPTLDYFATPNPPLATVTAQLATADGFDTSLDTLEAQVATASNSRRMFYDVTVEVTLAALASYVESTSLGDPAKIVSSGFERAGTGGGGAPVTLGQVANLHASLGDNAGEVDLQWNPMPGRSNYEIWRHTDPNNAAGWTYVCGCTPSQLTVKSLPSGTKLWFRLRALGGHESTGPYSDPATSFVG